MKSLALIATLILNIFLGICSAELIDRGGGLIYDTVLNITWLQDANYAATSGYSPDGHMNWDEAMAWVSSLQYYDPIRGVTLTGWRLPESKNRDGNGPIVGYDAESEMGYMRIINLGNYVLGPAEICITAPPVNTSFTDQNGKLVEIKNLQITKQAPGDSNHHIAYWSRNGISPLPTHAWTYQFDCGNQAYSYKPSALHAWPVRDGDVGSPNIPPIADAGPNITITSEEQNNLIIIGHATDPDNDTLQFR